MKECVGHHHVYLIWMLGLHLSILTHIGREDVRLAAYVKDVPKAGSTISTSVICHYIRDPAA